MEQRCEREVQMNKRLVFVVGIALATVFSATGARAADDCGTVKECAKQMVDLANELKNENAALLKRIEALEALAPKWNVSADDLGTLKKALSEPAAVRPVLVPFEQPGKCQAGEVMVGWQVAGAPDAVTIIGQIQCARVFGNRP
jgi:hypothetical protein